MGPKKAGCALACAMPFVVGCGPKDGAVVPGGTEPTTEVVVSDVTLADWSLSQQAIQPTFDTSRVWYAAAAGATEEVTATPTDPLASVELVVRDLDGVELDRFASNSAEIALEGGEQIVAVVTSADGNATGEYTLTPLPSDFPALDVWNAGEPVPGWFFLCNTDFGPLVDGGGMYLMIVDSLGIPRWLRRQEGLTFDFRPGPGGALTWVDSPEFEDRAAIVRRPGGELESWEPFDGGLNTHEFQLLENGNALMVADRLEDQDLTPWGGPASKPVVDQAIQEVTPSGELVDEWSTKGNIDLADMAPPMRSWLLPGIEPAHVNSVDIDPADGNWVISMRTVSQVRKVDRTTGETLWILGGSGSDFTFVDDARLDGWSGFSSQHSARVTGPNTVMVFDNSFVIFTGFTGDTRMVEYLLDHDAMTATIIRSWDLVGAEGTPVGGSVQRTPDDHTVIGFGTLEDVGGALPPAIVELDENHEPVFELRLPEGHWSYRVFKYDHDGEAWILP